MTTTVWQNLERTTPGEFGSSVAVEDDRSPNERVTEQSSSALRPLLGRAPVEVRNRLPNSRGDGAVVGVVGSGGSLPSGWSTSGQGTATVEIISLAQKGGRPSIRLRVSGETSSSFNIFFVDANVVGGNESQTWAISFWAELIGGDFTNIATARAQISGWTAAGGFVSGSTVNGSNLIGTIDVEEVRAAVSGSTPGATVESVRGFFQLSGITGAIDVTLDISAPQLEQASEPSPVQITGAGGLDITETGFPSPAFLRFDLSDDEMPTVFPDGGTFDVMVFGRRGSWIERGVEIASAGALTIGPESFTGAPPGVLAALGDIVGRVAVDRTLDDVEVARLVQRYRARGAKGLLVPGPQLKGDFEPIDQGTGTASYDEGTDVWSISRGDTNADSGRVSCPAAPGLYRADYEWLSGDRVAFRDTNFTTIASIESGIPSRDVVFAQPSGGTGNVVFQNSTDNSASTFRINSLRELRVQEDW